MRTSAASRPADADRENEDAMFVSQDVIVVLDGATARTETGCIHGVAWYAAALSGAIGKHASDSTVSLRDALAAAIADVAAMHPDCDLAHEGTPSAAVGILRHNADRIEHLVLGDITVILDLGEPELTVVIDNRVDTTAQAEREEQDRYPIGSPEKQAAMLRMKQAELAARNQPGGFFIAASDPSVVAEALVGAAERSRLRRAALLTDGAARAVCLFAVFGWSDLLDMLSANGPDALLDEVRRIEAADPDGQRWPRNKRSDDATVVLAG